jgi:hypothetical protein
VALINTGSFADLSLVTQIGDAPAEAEGVDSFGVLTKVEPRVPAETFEYASSAERRGLALQSLLLSKDAQGLFARLFDATADVYFLAWAWDFSGQPVVSYPNAGAAAGKVLIPMLGGSTREFVGAGVALFPARVVKAGIGMRMQIWQSNQDKRDFGATMTKVAEAIMKSNLNDVLSIAALATGVTGATIAMAEKAALELASVVGKILQESSDKYLDFYEGYFPACDPWTPESETFEGPLSAITLRRLT